MDEPKVASKEINEDFGNFEDLMKLEKYKGGKFTDYSGQEEFELFQPKVSEADPHRKVINVSMLYGSSKKAGPPVEERVRQKFSHKRVFGHKTN